MSLPNTHLAADDPRPPSPRDGSACRHGETGATTTVPDQHHTPAFAASAASNTSLPTSSTSTSTSTARSSVVSPVSSGRSERWHTNAAVEYAKHSVCLQDMTGAPLSRILVIYCGGTIGMQSDPDHGYYPVAGFLSRFLATNATFNDADFVPGAADLDATAMPPEMGPVLVLPPSIYGKRIAYQLLEYDPLKDSCNVSMHDWVQIATDIERHYHRYDAFVILHGTDTMAYSASALSFLLEDLGKTVIFTGSQIPFSVLRNDAKDNLLGALTLAGHYVIPEVTLFFANRLLRGNRASKTNTFDFNAFESPNLKPLATLGVNLEIEWAEVLRATRIAPFRAHKHLNPNVGALVFFPGITETAIRASLADPIRGVVLETYGTGNAPDDRPEILCAIADAVRRGVVVVNITQCMRGCVSQIYSTGHALASTGVVSGSDMTAECALVKLSYVLSFPEHDHAAVCRLMTESLRGELTVPILDRRSGRPTGSASWLGSVFRSALLAAPTGHRDAVDRLLRPLLLHAAAADNDIGALRDLSKQDRFIDSTDYEQRTSLHVAVAANCVEAAEWLIRHGANVHARDWRGDTPLFQAVMNISADRGSPKAREIALFLAKAGARLPAASHRLLTHVLFASVRTDDLDLVTLLHDLGFGLDGTSGEGRNMLHIAVLHRKPKTIAWLRERRSLFERLAEAEDVRGRRPVNVHGRGPLSH